MSSQLIRVSCSYKRVPHGSSVLPNVISGSLWQGTEHPRKCPVEAFNLTVPLGVIWGSMRMLHAAQLELPMEAIFKFSPLIMVNSERKTNPENKIIVKFLGNCFS